MSHPNTQTSAASDLFIMTDKKKKIRFLKVLLWNTERRQSHLGLSGFAFFLSHYVTSLFLFGGLLGQSPRHVFIGSLDLRVSGAGVGEFIMRIGVLQVPPHAGHV